ncbi:glycosyl transferase family 2 [Nonlabens arenilitoris]|uniref:Glycosyl transferase family 2 n=1 Tax=Nonlabens arenilitoris TaxID=1217969 RepID=A0A2S7UBA0_9FLAO|nr:glycosyltransferase [Nonlabens arenilitoris]PQJ32196.1 glycosyl transferase family 2 [Nonlabens arenilitoris]
MIFIEHENNRVTSSLHNGERAITAIVKIAQENPNQSIVIYKKGIDTTPVKDAIKNLLQPYVIVSSYNRLHKDLGYVEDSPFINISNAVTYPTWIKSTTAFTIHASLINQLNGQLNDKSNLLYWINSISKLARPLGVLSYQIPVYNSQEDQFDTTTLYRFVKQHYKTRWIFILFMCHMWYEKRFPLYAFAKAQFYKNRSLKLNVEKLQKPQDIISKKDLIYDVVIPTMGRASYLQDVLFDLNKQNRAPKSVIIIEQNACENTTSELDDLRNETYQFKLIHHFTNVTGACRARNEAISYSRAPWILLFDDDVRIEENFSIQVEDFLNRSNAKCVTFACLQYGEIENMQTFKQWESFGSGCSLVHRGVFEKCNFDMALEHGYGEDVDYGMQVRNAGFDVIYAPQIPILHLKAPVGGFRKQYVFPWRIDEIQPKPSPQIMYHRKKNYTHKQLLGYKMVQFFKTYGSFGTKNPYAHHKKYLAAWKQSEKWASQL